MMGEQIATKPQYPVGDEHYRRALAEVQEDLYGSERRGNPGLIQRVKEIEKLTATAKAFLAGMAINVLFSSVALAKLFGWI